MRLLIFSLVLLVAALGVATATLDRIPLETSPGSIVAGRLTAPEAEAIFHRVAGPAVADIVLGDSSLVAEMMLSHSQVARLWACALDGSRCDDPSPFVLGQLEGREVVRIVMRDGWLFAEHLGPTRERR